MKIDRGEVCEVRQGLPILAHDVAQHPPPPVEGGTVGSRALGPIAWPKASLPPPPKTMLKRSIANLYVTLLLGLTLTNCADEPLFPTFSEGVDPVEAMYASVDLLQERPEHLAHRVKVQHLLVGVGPKFGDRLPAEAETRAAEILQELAAANGTNFGELVEQHTNDTYPGIYTMIAGDEPLPASEVYLRKAMVPAFGDAAWRLRVGEVGVAPYDPMPPTGRGTSRFGIHIVKRLE